MVTVKRSGNYIEFWINNSLIYDVRLSELRINEMLEKQWFTKDVEKQCINILILYYGKAN
jgi:hypothetical protein